MARNAEKREGVLLSIATFSEHVHEERFVERLLSLLRNSAADYFPNSFQAMFVDRPFGSCEGAITPLRDDTLPQLIQSLQISELGEVRLTKGSPLDVSLTLPMRFRGPLQHDYVSFGVGQELVNSLEKRRMFLRVAQLMFRTCEGFFGSLRIPRLVKMEPSADFPGAERMVPMDLEEGLPPPEWGFLLGPDYVKLLGPDRLKRAPCEVVQEFDTDHFLLLLAENFEVLERDQRVLEERRQRLVEHLGPEHFSYVELGSPKRVLPQLARGQAESL